MYEVIRKDSGQRLALCEQPRYVRIIPNTGVYVQCSADQAEGIAVNGTVFALSDHVDGLHHRGRKIFRQRQGFP